MAERIVVFNAYVGNQRDPQLASWLKDLDPTVAIVSEMGNAKDNLRRVGRVLFNEDEGTPVDVGLVVAKGKVDNWSGGRLTQRVPRADKPNMWKDRWYVRARVNDKVYYSVHANAIIGAGSGNDYANNPGAREWARGMQKLKQLIKEDMDRGLAVRVGGDFNFPRVSNPGRLTPGDLFRDLGFDTFVDKVMWFAWDPRYDHATIKRVMPKAPGADAHKSLLVALESKGKRPTPKTETLTTTVSVATSNLFRGLSNEKIKEDINWIAKNFSPVMWGFQEIASNLGVVRTALKDNDYRLALPKKDDPYAKDNAIAYDPKRVRLIGTGAVKVANAMPGQKPRWINSAHFKELKYGLDIYYFNTHISSHIEVGGKARDNRRVPVAKRHIHQLSRLVQERSKDKSIAFFSGDFNIDEDADDRVKTPGFMQDTFKEFDLVSIYDERDTPASVDTFGKRKIDIIGRSKLDERVKGIAVRVSPKQNSDHKFVLATYQVSGLKGGYLDPSYVGSPTNPNQNPDDSKPAKVKFEKDDGPQADHSECCGGEAL